MASPLQLPQLIKRFKVKESQLEEQCSDLHLAKIARLEKFVWSKWVKHLGLSNDDITDIEDDASLDSAGKALRALSKWQELNAFLATYENLIKIFLEGGNALLAQEVCKMLNGTYYLLHILA